MIFTLAFPEECSDPRKEYINVVSYSSGLIRAIISAVINRADEAKALNALYEGLFPFRCQVLNVFYDQVWLESGGIDQATQAQSEYLMQIKTHLENTCIIGLANSRK